MPKKKVSQIQRIMERDRGQCGVHLLGCGKPASSPTNDHILPESLLRACKLDFPASYDLLSKSDLNRQPMCRTCNNETKRERVTSRPLLNGNWPMFSCQCHTLQCRSDDVMVLLTRIFPPKHLRKHKPAPEAVILDQGDRLWMAIPLVGFGPMYRGAQRVTVQYGDGVRHAWLTIITEQEHKYTAPLSGDIGHYFVNFGETPPGWGIMNRRWAERVGITSMVAMSGHHDDVSFYGWAPAHNSLCIMRDCELRSCSWSHGLCEWHVDEARRYSWRVRLPSP